VSGAIKYSGLFNNDPTKGDVPKIVLSPPDAEEGGQVAGKKKKGVARKTGDPDSFRGQSPDDEGVSLRQPTRPAMLAPRVQGSSPQSQLPAPRGQGSLTEPFIETPPARPSARPASALLARAQSPDSLGGYGGQGINQMSPGPQPYTANQGPNGYSSQPPITGAPPAGSIYPPGYTGQANPPYGAQGGPAPPPGYQPPPGSGPIFGGGPAPPLSLTTDRSFRSTFI